MATFNKGEINAISNRIKHGALCMAVFRRVPGISEEEHKIIERGIRLLEDANYLLTGEHSIQVELSGSFCDETPGALSALRVEDGKLSFIFTDETFRDQEDI